MKQIKRLTALSICAIFLLAGCTKYGTAVSTINSYSYANRQLTVNAIVIDKGGCDYFMEQGFCYSLFCPPSINDVTSTQVKVHDYTEIDSFSAVISLPLLDTAYYVCSYIKNSAGLSYSDVVKVSTKASDYPDAK